jgi:lysozyme
MDIFPPNTDPFQLINLAANKLTIPFEGVRLAPYQDVRGIWTIGTGSTFDLAGNRVTANTPPITEAQNLLLLRREMWGAFMAVENGVTAPINVNQAAALVDMAYNVGDGAFKVSTVRLRFNAGATMDAANHLLDWDMSGGAVVEGLARRCEARRVLFLTPVWQA